MHATQCLREILSAENCSILDSPLVVMCLIVLVKLQRCYVFLQLFLTYFSILEN